jgi:CBS domain-containing protein
MAQTIRDVMTPNPIVFPATASLVEAAQAMRDSDLGDVLVEQEGKLCGIVTDRDIVVRAIAEGRKPTEVRLGDICTGDLTTLAPDASVEEAEHVMRGQALRRVPIVDGGRPIGVVSLGDLAIERDRDSALADISAAPPSD